MLDRYQSVIAGIASPRLLKLQSSSTISIDGRFAPKRYTNEELKEMKVRKGQICTFRASGWDRFDRKPNTPNDGTVVRVCAPHGCPAPNVMGHCFIETLDGKFIGLVSTASLEVAS